MAWAGLGRCSTDSVPGGPDACEDSQASLESPARLEVEGWLVGRRRPRRGSCFGSIQDMPRYARSVVSSGLKSSACGSLQGSPHKRTSRVSWIVTQGSTPLLYTSISVRKSSGSISLRVHRKGTIALDYFAPLCSCRVCAFS